MLTPLDIETKEFKKTLGGYAKQDVDEFKQVVLDDYKSIYLENISMKDRLSALSSVVQRYKAMEDVMQNTLIVAQSTSEDVKRSANDKARAILAEAEARVATMQMESKQKILELELRQKEMEYEIESYKLKAASELRSLLSILDKKDITVNDNNVD